MRALILFLLILLPQTATAQDREGNDTAGEWVIDHQRSFGLWDSMCDRRTSGDAVEQRCYLRYVDVFSGRPNFAALFLFVTQGPKVEFGLEAGTQFAQDGFKILKDDATLWAAPKPGCLVGLSCLYEQDEAASLLDAMRAGQAFAFDFTDRHGVVQSLRWDLTAFADAMVDFSAESDKRGL